MKQQLNPHEFPDKLNKYEYDLFDLCGLLHGSAIGSGDHMNEKARTVACAELFNRLNTWGESSDRYDQAVYALIQATLAEQLKLN